jgi:hypothetical protein
MLLLSCDKFGTSPDLSSVVFFTAPGCHRDGTAAREQGGCQRFG